MNSSHDNINYYFKIILFDIQIFYARIHLMIIYFIFLRNVQVSIYKGACEDDCEQKRSTNKVSIFRP